MKQKAPFSLPMTRRETAFGLLWLLLHCFVLPDALSLLLYDLLPRLGGPALPPVWLTFACHFVSFGAVVLGLRHFLQQSFRDLCAGPLRAVSGTVEGFMVYYLLGIAAGILLTALGAVEAATPNDQVITELLRTDYGPMAAAAIWLAPLAEECMFRGVIFGRLRQKRRWLAYVVSALAFALYHLWQYLFLLPPETLLLALVQYIPGSLALAFAFDRGGTIWSAIALHMWVNAMGVLA